MQDITDRWRTVVTHIQVHILASINLTPLVCGVLVQVGPLGWYGRQTTAKPFRRTPLGCLGGSWYYGIGFLGILLVLNRTGLHETNIVPKVE
ncbi:uncharacterized protein F4812DRAFT_110159 [Daldinia caldariorum]|uniref:uncharacterized protein n=1 Tax=Daldinia caldariorum TaxID=326644 RepID=UPI0020086139|nr:uncharacterized protein F4812DRAFT_110159 [Daldinia caldariorum]KAI1465735.1 hypothetical protein F4812DRAFT_110159 [Daldinia caldariorum]